VGRALALDGVRRRRPPPLLAQLLQPRLEHCRWGNFSLRCSLDEILRLHGFRASVCRSSPVLEEVVLLHASSLPLWRICVCASRFQCGVSCVGSLRWELEMISQLWVGG
jgi:hypothetical protein